MSSSGGQRAEEFWRGFSEEKNISFVPPEQKKITMCSFGTKFISQNGHDLYRTNYVYSNGKFFKLKHINGG